MTEEPENEQQELFEHYRFNVDRGQEPMRLDRYLSMRIEGVSRTRVQAAIEAGCVLVNENPTKSNYKVKPLDAIAVLLPDEPQEYELVPEPVDFPVVYEDDDVVVVDKPAGLVVHPGVGNYSGTLLNGLLYRYPTPALVHRIDKDTSGLIIAAKNETAQAILAKQFFYHTIERLYTALVWGDMNGDEGTITGNLARSPQDRRFMAVCDYDHGKHAVTHWRVLERFGYVTLVECRLETGRTHQIRAHMRHIGHPLFNDAAYGGNGILKGVTFTRYRQFVANCFAALPRQALHARVLGFEHPSTGQHMHFESPLPDDFTSCVERWRAYTSSRQQG
ncbi:MAG: RluA family pseudouridine synthase [Bacteroidales bacterium]|nr:RluA family pseudouridine synthase [Bacteroidales bacterium]